MGIGVDQAVCPKCGRSGLFINTDGWKPVAIRCYSIKNCGWNIDLKQFWPKKEKAP
jgi:hypothetical protein